MAENQGVSPETWLARALGRHDEATHGVVPGIHPATTFLREGDLSYPGLVYARPDNPTFTAAEQLLSQLEGAQESILFGSGMAAATAVFQTLRPGDHVVGPTVMYWALRRWLKGYCEQFGIALTLVDMADTDAIAAAVVPGKTQVVWVETPANPTWSITDLSAAADIAHKAGAVLAVDNTVPTPLLTRPIEHGADIVMHAATKYLNGHSDVVMGTLSCARADHPAWQAMKAVRRDIGGIPGPFEAWLLLRGMRTLALRVERACGTAMKVANHFHGHARVAEVLYPGLPSHPGHAVAARQMTGGFGGMLSIRVAGGGPASVEAAARLRLWTRATSLGGVESLVEHRASVEGPDSPCPPDLLRLSCGIESADDLIADLEQALAGV
ncbi:aminotransferase class I/II-fold pyridoxal phosphate-dependent enzyme [Aerophototrophica crusticola]|uniref:Aminotransferase class I/II-fold pyridoxal phosphate-dependent enzyme n=1 Tax=Aerophototrophica crusticola TaxID=1709002 RepID=A0A858R8J1_9PROT|nr:aminotransferase class I/II-fold pyridoxal phosphate-dependent enzyme [Rhodospirillaceae bacterium B3]